VGMLVAVPATGILKVSTQTIYNGIRGYSVSWVRGLWQTTFGRLQQSSLHQSRTGPPVSAGSRWQCEAAKLPQYHSLL